jgi:hypothetical protein
LHQPRSRDAVSHDAAASEDEESSVMLAESRISRRTSP